MYRYPNPRQILHHKLLGITVSTFGNLESRFQRLFFYASLLPLLAGEGWGEGEE